MMSISIFSILMLSITILTSADQLVYIIPDVSSGEQEACPAQPCHNLTYYTLPHTFINSNTVLQFMAGIHTIGTWVRIDSVTNMTLRGTEANETIIRCTEDGGFFFFNVDGLLIEKMTLLHCGTTTGLSPINPGPPAIYLRAALWLEFVTTSSFPMWLYVRALEWEYMLLVLEMHPFWSQNSYSVVAKLSM